MLAAYKKQPEGYIQSLSAMSLWSWLQTILSWEVLNQKVAGSARLPFLHAWRKGE